MILSWALALVVLSVGDKTLDIRHETSHHITVCVMPFPLASSDSYTDANNNVNMNFLDIDLELDLNVNVISPMWPENDFLNTAKDLTDAIFANDLSVASTNTNIDINTNINAVTTSDFDWNFYYEDIRPETNDTSNVLYQVDNTNNHIDSVLESWSDTCSLDVLKDSLFELEIFNDVNNVSTSTSTSASVSASTSVATDPIIEWNRRRSLLYDKNEFVQSDRGRNCHEHERRIKSNASCLPTSSSTSTMDQRTFRCSVRDCDKTYYKASHLKSHMRRHSGVKPFACDWDGCKWRFSRSDELARHKRSHSGIKPYTCDLCDKAFSRSDHLSKHAKVHMKKLALYGTPIITKKCNYKYLTVNRIQVE